ncbi:MAG: hypothetical protein V2A77_08535 [Pseudomonadota bacterium]
MSGKAKSRQPHVSPRVVATVGEALEAVRAGRPVAEVSAELVAQGWASEQVMEVASELGRQASQEAADLAAGLAAAPGFAEKDVHRALKRALYLLEQKGFKVEAPRGEPVLKPVAIPALPAYVGLPDAAGHQLVVATIPAQGGYNACLCGLSPRGVEHFSLLSVPKKSLRKMVERIEEDSRLPVAETDETHVLYLLEEARAASMAEGEALDPEFATFLRVFSGLAAGRRETPAIYDVIPAAEVEADESLLERCVELLQDIGLLWSLPLYLVRPYADELDRAEGSGLIIGRELREARRLEIIGKAAAELFDAGRRKRWRRRLEECAFVMARKGRPDEARIALATAIHFGHEIAASRPHPLAAALIGRSLDLLRAKERERMEFSPIITPGGPGDRR